jgi:hypothetical protein
MRKQYLALSVVIFFQLAANAQKVSYSDIDMSVVAKRASIVYNRNLQFLFDSFAGYDVDGRRSKKEKDQAALHISTLKKNFDQHKKYPDSIASGWHAVAITNNKDFYKDAKVFVSRNSIVQLVVDGCIRLSFTSKDKIKNAASALTLNDVNTEFEVLNVYFINDLDSAALIDEPIQPGFVCFWTSKDKYLNERLMINSVIRDFIGKLHEQEPECLETGVPFYILKPGKYKFRATKTGNDKEETFEVKSGMCLRYRLK